MLLSGPSRCACASFWPLFRSRVTLALKSLPTTCPRKVEAAFWLRTYSALAQREVARLSWLGLGLA